MSQTSLASTDRLPNLKERESGDRVHIDSFLWNAISAAVFNS